MIKENELRLGNYILFEPISDLGYEIIKVKELPFKKRNNANGILLNEEWLLKFGFKEYLDNLFLDIKQRITLCYFDKNENQFSILQDDKEIALASGRVKYVHQLQNLYFALTGEELVYAQEGGI